MRLFFITVLTLLAQIAYAQDGKYQFGASNSGIGGASITQTNSWALFNNVGVLGRLTSTEGFVGYQNRYNIPEFQVIGGGAVHSMKHFTTGLAYHRFGGLAYNQQLIKLAVGNQFQMVSLGAGINIIQFQAEGIGAKRKVVLEFGGVAEIIPQLVVGAHIFNFRESQFVPAVMKAGLSYRPNTHVMINVETEKELGFREVFKAGVQYQVIKPLYFRTGISTKPFRSAFGLGFRLDSFLLDYAYSSDSSLGAIHEVSLAYQLLKR